MSSTSTSLLSSSSITRKEADTHFKWASLIKFIILASTYPINIHNFDMYSRKKVTIYECIIVQIFMGLPYMFLDSFVKQYTKKFNSYTYMNPILRGIQFGVFAQTALLFVLNSQVLIDLWRFIIPNLKENPSWNLCRKNVSAPNCFSFEDIYQSCIQQKSKTKYKYKKTSAFLYYLDMFQGRDRGTVTLKMFFAFLIWIVNFFVASVTDVTFFKICRLIHWTRVISTLSLLLTALTTTTREALTGFGELLSLNDKFDWLESVKNIMISYSIGLMTFYDYDVLSSYTMTDNSVVFFMFAFNLEGIIRSWVFKTMIVRFIKCFTGTEKLVTQNYPYIFSFLPLSAEFMPITKIYFFFIFIPLVAGVTCSLAMMTISMTKLLQTEFPSVKTLYMVGMISFAGFMVSVPFKMYLAAWATWFLPGIYKGMYVSMVYVAFLKTLVILWVYGTQRFATDVHFWLGFKLTKFWMLSWTVLPLLYAITFVFFLENILSYNSKDTKARRLTLCWLLLTIILVAISHIKTITMYLINNALSKAFLASPKYGPPDPKDRQRRRNFNETIHLRSCHHNCHILDEEIDCNHLQMAKIINSQFSSDSIVDVFAPSETRGESVILKIDNT